MRTLSTLAVLVACTSSAVATPPGVRVWESKESGSITEGETTLETDPDTAYAAATDYSRWTSIFPDIARVEVTKQQGVDARVTLVHQAGNRDNVHFHNQPQARMVWFEDTGGRAEVWVEIVFLPGDRPGTTRVHSRLYADVKGVVSIVVPDSKVRALRQERIAGDLGHLHTYFGAQVAGAR